MAKTRSKSSTMTSRLDALVRKIVYARDVRCVTEGEDCKGPLEVSHFLGRANYALRWDLRNCNAQCQWHNRYHDKDREPYRRFLAERYGDDIFDEFSRITAEWYKTGGASSARKEDIFAELTRVWDELR